MHLFCYTRQLFLHRNLFIWLWMRNLQGIILRVICISMYILYTCIIRFYCFFAVMREIECHAPSIRSHLHFYMNIRYRVKGVKNDWFTKQFRLFWSLTHYAWDHWCFNCNIYHNTECLILHCTLTLPWFRIQIFLFRIWKNIVGNLQKPV